MTIQTDNWYADMQAMQTELDYFDTSNEERDHESFSKKHWCSGSSEVKQDSWSLLNLLV